jgi:hypothetical protein
MGQRHLTPRGDGRTDRTTQHGLPDRDAAAQCGVWLAGGQPDESAAVDVLARGTGTLMPTSADVIVATSSTPGSRPSSSAVSPRRPLLMMTGHAGDRGFGAEALRDARAIVARMADERSDPLSRAQHEVISRLTELARALADLNPVSHAGQRAEQALHPAQRVLQGLAGYSALAIDPLVGLVDAQREFADRMAEWAQLQRQFADHMAEWAALQRGLADSLGLVLRPLAEGGHQVSDVLHHVSGQHEGKADPGGRGKKGTP